MTDAAQNLDRDEREERFLVPLPETWKWSTIDTAGAHIRNAIVDGPFGSNLKLTDYVEVGPVTVLTTRNIDGHMAGVRYITHAKFEELRRSAVIPNDILMAKIGSCGKVGIYPPDGPVAIIPANLLKMTVGPQFDLHYVFYYFKSATFQKHLKTIIKATAQPAFGVTSFKKLPLPVAPKNEQSRIVSKIDELFSRIDEGERALERVQKLVERYRQSVLKAAVSGELTREWREKQAKSGVSIETGEALLARILTTRREAWEQAELDKMKARGIKPKDDKWKQKYKEPSPPDTSELPELPKEWVWAGLGQVCELENGDRSKNYPGRANFIASGVPFINAGHLKNQRIDKENLDFISEDRFQMLRAGFIRYEDILFCLRGSLGKFALCDLKKGAIASSLVILRPDISGMVNWVLTYLGSPLARGQIKLYDNGTAQPNLAGSDLAKFAVPICSLVEQQSICEAVALAMHSVSTKALGLSLTRNLSLALRQTALKSAFTGSLVAQDVQDEPAAVLLERIAVERSTAPAKSKRGPKIKKKAAK